MPLTGEQINWLLDGYDISLMKGSWLAIWVDRRVWLILVEELCRFTGEKLLVR
jgi:hypothetical protein